MAMTAEERLQKIEENLLTTAELAQANERRAEQRFKKIEENLRATTELAQANDRRADQRSKKIDEHLLVMAELARNSERHWEERFEQHDIRLARLEQVVEHLASGARSLLRSMKALSEQVSGLSDDEVTTRAMLQSLIKTVDRFVRGRGGDGRKPR